MARVLCCCRWTRHPLQGLQYVTCVCGGYYTQHVLLHITTHTVLGKAEGRGENWHGHVTAVTIAPAYRRQRLADKLMKLLEDVTEHMYVAVVVVVLVKTGVALQVGVFCACSLLCLLLCMLNNGFMMVLHTGIMGTLWTCLCASPTVWQSACTPR